MRIVFTRAARGESVATIHRSDGVVVELPSFSRKHQVPHDLAHAVAEREFGLAGGVFGTIAAGAVFDNMRVLAGRLRHDAAARSARILAANKQTLTLAELMAGVLHREVEGPTELRLTESARRHWGMVREEPFPWTDEQTIAAADLLRGLAAEFAALTGQDGLEFRWPDRLVATVPPAAVRRRERPVRRA